MSRFLLPGLLALLGVSRVAWADFKVGYVDLPRALKEVSEGQAAQAKLEKETAKRKSDLDAEQNKLRADKELLDKQGPVMSAQARDQRSVELQKRLFELSQKAEKVQAELQQMGQTELKKIFDKIDPIVASIAQREGLTLVFDKAAAGLVYAPPSLDLTNELVRTYNDKYKVAASSPAKKSEDAGR